MQAPATMKILEVDAAVETLALDDEQLNWFEVASNAKQKTADAGTSDLAMALRRLTPPAPRSIELPPEDRCTGHPGAPSLPTLLGRAVVRSPSDARLPARIALLKFARAAWRGAGLVVVRGMMFITFATVVWLPAASRRLLLSTSSLLARLASQGRRLAFMYRTHRERAQAFRTRVWAGKVLASARARLPH